MSARTRIELHSSSSSEEERTVTEQDPAVNLGERFRLLARQVLRRCRYFSPREASNVLRSAKRYLLRQYQLNHKKCPSQPHLYSYTQGRRLPGQLGVRSKQVNQQQKVHEVKSKVLSTTTNQDFPAFKSVNNIDAVGVYGTRDGKFERLLLEPVVNLQVCVCVNRRSPVSRHFFNHEFTSSTSSTEHRNSKSWCGTVARQADVPSAGNYYW